MSEAYAIWVYPKRTAVPSVAIHLSIATPCGNQTSKCSNVSMYSITMLYTELQGKCICIHEKVVIFTREEKEQGECQVSSTEYVV